MRRKRENAPAKRRITIDLDPGMLSGVDELAGRVNESRNTFIATAIESRVRAERRARTDAEFARMAGDTGYQKMLLEEDRIWAPASDAAWRRMDKDEAAAEPANQADRGRAAKGRRVPR